MPASRVAEILRGVLATNKDAAARPKVLAVTCVGALPVLHLQTDAADGELLPYVLAPVDQHAQVHQATGMTAAQLDVSLAQALALLPASCVRSGAHCCRRSRRHRGPAPAAGAVIPPDLGGPSCSWKWLDYPQ